MVHINNDEGAMTRHTMQARSSDVLLHAIMMIRDTTKRGPR